MGLFKKIGNTGRNGKATIVESRIEDMSFTSPSHDVVVDDRAALNYESEAGVPSSKIEEINSLRDDLSRTAAALRESMRLNSNSVAEIEKLSAFMKSAEINALSLERLEPENLHMKARVEALQNDLSKKTLWAGELESKSMAYKARFEEARKDLESCYAKINTLQDRVKSGDAAQGKHSAAMASLKSERQNSLHMLSTAQGENAALRTQLKSLEVSEKALARQNTELEKKLDVIGAQILDERREKENAASELKGLRLDFAELKGDHMETLSKLDKAMHEVERVNQALSENRQRAEDKVFALNATIDGLQAQQKIYEDMSKYDGIEKEKLRSEVLSQNTRVAELESRLESRTNDMHNDRGSLERAKENYDALNKKFLAMISELEGLRRENQAQAKKLEEYSSISGVAIGQSFYADGKRKTAPKNKRANPRAVKKADGQTQLKLVIDEAS